MKVIYLEEKDCQTGIIPFRPFKLSNVMTFQSHLGLFFFHCGLQNDPFYLKKNNEAGVSLSFVIMFFKQLPLGFGADFD